MSRLAPSVEISAVMPAYNEEANLEESVGRMARALAQSARGFEIIVVDDGSQDGTGALLNGSRARIPICGSSATRSIAATGPRFDRALMRRALPGSS